MKKVLVVVSMMLCCMIWPVQKSQAQIPIVEIIKIAVKKVIQAIDLNVQRLQNKTIWLQNAQKTLENKMSELKLKEIGDWAKKQKALYAKYFDELRKVKAALAYYHRVKDIIQKQGQLINEYKAAWALFQQDKNFTNDELNYMRDVYDGMMEESVKNIDQLSLVINAFVTQMTDGKRMEIINAVDNKLDENLGDLREFNNQNKMISLQRASEKGDIETVKRLYGL